jgi:hypothetical protein
MDYSIFTDEQLAAAVSQYDADFRRFADEGYLYAATAKAQDRDAALEELRRRHEFAKFYAAMEEDAVKHGFTLDPVREAQVFELNHYRSEIV